MDTNGSTPPTVYGLWHKDGKRFSAYALSIIPGSVEQLTGVLMVDRPVKIDPDQLSLWEIMYSKSSLIPMTNDRERGIACNMFIAPESQELVRPFAPPASRKFYAVLNNFLAIRPNVDLEMQWDPDRGLWTSTPRVYPEGGVAGKPRFHLGQIVATVGATAALITTFSDPRIYLRRHVTGDWGELCDEDKTQNEQSARDGYRILSRYSLVEDMPIYIITEADRSVTTILLPEEY